MDQIHFVYNNHDVADSKQPKQVNVAPGLVEDAFSNVHQQYGQICGGCRSNHISRKLLMPRSVGNNKFAFCGAEVTKSPAPAPP